MARADGDATAGPNFGTNIVAERRTSGLAVAQSPFRLPSVGGIYRSLTEHIASHRTSVSSRCTAEIESPPPSLRQPTAADRRASGPLSPWDPLRVPLYRAFWIASLASNLGTWIHEVGAGWLMTSLDPSPLLVAGVRASMALPILLLALPVGVLADRVDRRRLLLITQLVLLSTAATLAGMTATQRIEPWSLLLLTAVMGFGMVIHAPTWQASIPELVPRTLLPQAVALGSISFNLARAVGPAVGGLLIGIWGAWSAFAANACSFAGVIAVLMLWRREETESSGGLTFGQSMKEGLQFVAHTLTMRHVLIRVGLFVFPASALWSLLPLVTRVQLAWDARGYGLLVGGIGGGAVLMALAMPRIRQTWGSDRAISVAMGVFGAALAVIVVSSNRFLALGMMPVLGGCWMLTLTTLNATAQMTLPRPLRARGMACYLMSMATAMGCGSLVWGAVARLTSPNVAILLAAGSLPILAVLGNRLSIGTALTDHGQ